MNRIHHGLNSSPIPNPLEEYVRNAIAYGEISPAVEDEIRTLIYTGHLTQRDFTLLSILRDAIQDGCVRRVKQPWEA